jgi:uncharacterized protein
LEVSLKIAVIEQGVGVQGGVFGRFARQCVRCLKEFEDRAEIPVTATYQQTSSVKSLHAQATGRGPRASDDLQQAREPELSEDVYSLHGDRLEFAEMLREHIILATPVQPLCHEQCRGLCPVCGEDLNERECGCDRDVKLNPFRVLRELRDHSGRTG